VAQLVEVLHYKPEGRGFDSRLGRWDFLLTYSSQPHSASTRNPEMSARCFSGGGGGRKNDRLTTLPP
jgi:hypothetical protein